MRRIKDHIVDHIIAILGLIIAGLNYFKVGPEKVVQALSSVSFVFYILAGVLIGWGACRIFYDMKFKRKGMSRKEARAAEEQFQSDFAKYPYWVKVFFKAILEKEDVFSKANDSIFEMNQEFFLQFVDYKTVGHNDWQFSMSKENKEYFEKNPQLLADVKDEDIRSHARKTGDMYYTHNPFHNLDRGFDWWYFSDDDYVEAFS